MIRVSFKQVFRSLVLLPMAATALTSTSYAKGRNACEDFQSNLENASGLPFDLQCSEKDRTPEDLFVTAVGQIRDQSSDNQTLETQLLRSAIANYDQIAPQIGRKERMGAALAQQEGGQQARTYMKALDSYIAILQTLANPNLSKEAHAQAIKQLLQSYLPYDFNQNVCRVYDPGTGKFIGQIYSASTGEYGIEYTYGKATTPSLARAKVHGVREDAILLAIAPTNSSDSGQRQSVSLASFSQNAGKIGQDQVAVDGPLCNELLKTKDGSINISAIEGMIEMLGREELEPGAHIADGFDKDLSRDVSLSVMSGSSSIGSGGAPLKSTQAGRAN